MSAKSRLGSCRVASLSASFLQTPSVADFSSSLRVPSFHCEDDFSTTLVNFSTGDSPYRNAALDRFSASNLVGSRSLRFRDVRLTSPDQPHSQGGRTNEQRTTTELASTALLYPH